MTELPTVKATNAQICALATSIASRADAIAVVTAPLPAELSGGRPDPTWLRAQVALLVNNIDTLSQWVQPATDPKTIILSRVQRLLLTQYAEVDSGYRSVAGAALNANARQAARAALVQQGLIVDAPDNHAARTWLTDLGRALVP